MLLNEGRHGGKQILSSESMRRMETPTTTLAARSGLTFGYGLGVYPYFRNGVLLHGHSGDADGYLSYFGYSRELDVAYFLSVNHFNWPTLGALRRVVEDWMVDGHSSTPPPSVRIPAGILSQYTGRYEPAAWRFAWTEASDRAQQIVSITLSDGVLYTHTANGNRQALIPVTDKHFRRSDEPVATSAFVHDGDGRLYFQDDENYVRVE